MFKQKCGRMTPCAWLNMEMEQTSPVLMLGGGILCLLAGIIVRLAAGSPYPMIHNLNLASHLPPAWILSLLWSIAFFTIGCAAGSVLGHRRRGMGREKGKAMLLFLGLIATELCWYPLFFCVSLVFLCALLSVIILCISVSLTVQFRRISGLAGAILLFHDIWLIYMVVMSFSVLFR